MEIQINSITYPLTQLVTQKSYKFCYNLLQDLFLFACVGTILALFPINIANDLLQKANSSI